MLKYKSLSQQDNEVLKSGELICFCLQDVLSALKCDFICKFLAICHKNVSI